ncbi:MAG: sulfatase-like hydrolase/transferase [Maioricimonas sp. JB049]
MWQRFVLLRALILVMSVLVPLSIRDVQAADRPNVLFLFADDQCYETIRAFGHADIDTPHLDRLVERGTTFTRCYNMGSWSGAVCVASRTMLNTGRFLWRANEIYKTSEQERQEGRWWSEYMKQAGYRTYMTGKWHVRANAEKAFDVAVDVRGGMPNQTPAGYNRPHEGQPDSWSPSDPGFEGFWKGGTHWSEIVGNHGVDFINDAAGRDEPFFMYVAFNAPHDPRQSPQEFVDMYPLDRIEVPENFAAEYPFKDAIGCSSSLRDEKLAPFPRTEYSIKVNRQEYYAIITHMDQQIGRVLDALDESGQAENTWIFFTADHGLAVGHHGLVGKQNMYEHSMRVPFMVVAPGVAAGARIDAPIYLQDVMPTTLELAGVEKPEHVEFHSLLPMLRGERTESPYDAIYGAYLALQRSVIDDGYKLILYPKIGRARLYHVAEDPPEMRDLADEPEMKPVMRKLFLKFRELQKEMGDELDVAAAFPELAG